MLSHDGDISFEQLTRQILLPNQNVALELISTLTASGQDNAFVFRGDDNFLPVARLPALLRVFRVVERSVKRRELLICGLE